MTMHIWPTLVILSVVSLQFHYWLWSHLVSTIMTGGMPSETPGVHQLTWYLSLNTWILCVIFALQEKHSAKIIFLMGTTVSTDSDLEADLAEEISENHDVVREDFLDSYKNLTLKTLAGIKWADQYCAQAEFVMKTDDDMFINLDNILEYLNREFGDGASEKVITGCVKNDPNGPHKPLSAGGQPVPALPFKSVHPLFMAGAGYVISGKSS